MDTLDEYEIFRAMSSDKPGESGTHYFSRPVQLSNFYSSMHTLEELLERDSERKKDGFPPRIRIARILRPGKAGKVVLVPTTTEEKFYHDNRPLRSQDEQDQGGSGEGKEGDVIAEEADEEEGQGNGGYGAGKGDGEDHTIGSDAYELGKVLTQQLQLPNLTDKGKKYLAEPRYDLTDKKRGSGQVEDKKASLLNIIKTNIALGIIDDLENPDLEKLLVDPRDRVYRILSREDVYESQALVFFARDYSGSMYGKPSEVVVSQHLLIYCWLMYQYDKRVETRFVLHDTEAKEVPDFHTYYSLMASGGTDILSVFKYINEAVQRDNLAADNNIYVFYGGDGDDYGGEDYTSRLVDELKRTMSYSNRLGITIVGDRKSSFETNLENSGLLANAGLIRFDSISQTADQERLIEGIKKLVSP